MYFFSDFENSECSNKMSALERGLSSKGYDEDYAPKENINLSKYHFLDCFPLISSIPHIVYPPHMVSKKLDLVIYPSSMFL